MDSKTALESTFKEAYNLMKNDDDEQILETLSHFKKFFSRSCNWKDKIKLPKLEIHQSGNLLSTHLAQ